MPLKILGNTFKSSVPPFSQQSQESFPATESSHLKGKEQISYCPGYLQHRKQRKENKMTLWLYY